MALWLFSMARWMDFPSMLRFESVSALQILLIHIGNLLWKTFIVCLLCLFYASHNQSASLMDNQEWLSYEESNKKLL